MGLCKRHSPSGVRPAQDALPGGRSPSAPNDHRLPSANPPGWKSRNLFLHGRLERISKEGIATLACLYDRFARALDPFTPERGEVGMTDREMSKSLTLRELASQHSSHQGLTSELTSGW